MSRRQASIERETKETRIRLSLDLDGGGRTIQVPDGFLGHMLESLSRHGGFGLEIEAEGDTHVDLHHTVEDIGIVLGDALDAALGERLGVVRFAHAFAPLDEALARAVVDLSGRGFLQFDLPSKLEHSWVTREFSLTLLEDFLQALAERGRLTVHLSVLSGRNPHHVAEAAFKALALALRQAASLRPGEQDVPSTKGTLTE